MHVYHEYLCMKWNAWLVYMMTWNDCVLRDAGFQHGCLWTLGFIWVPLNIGFWVDANNDWTLRVFANNDWIFEGMSTMIGLWVGLANNDWTLRVCPQWSDFEGGSPIMTRLWGCVHNHWTLKDCQCKVRFLIVDVWFGFLVFSESLVLWYGAYLMLEWNDVINAC
jgi:hypothetical protein